MLLARGRSPGRVAYPAVTCTVDTDLLVVGGGYFGLWTAVVAKQHDLRAEPGLSVALLDREDFPRDKPCGDGIAPHVLDLLAEVGVTGIMHDQVPVRRLRLSRGDLAVDRTMARPAWVVPREIFDHRLVEVAQAAGAHLLRHRVRTIDLLDDGVTLDGAFETRVLVGADGAHSAVRRGLGGTPGPAALALRGYAPTPPGRSGAQVIAFGPSRQPSYAWSFDRGDGYSNVGYGESLSAGRARPTRVELMMQLDSLLPGATVGGVQWRGHHLPLSSWSWRPANGRDVQAGKWRSARQASAPQCRERATLLVRWCSRRRDPCLRCRSTGLRRPGRTGTHQRPHHHRHAPRPAGTNLAGLHFDSAAVRNQSSAGVRSSGAGQSLITASSCRYRSRRGSFAACSRVIKCCRRARSSARPVLFAYAAVIAAMTGRA